VSLLGSTLSLLINQAQNALVTGRSPARRGNTHPNIVPYQAFDTADGAVVVAVGSERQWPRFCDAIGLAELAVEPRFATNADRVTNRAELQAILADRLGSRSTNDWVAALEAADVPCGPVLSVREALESPAAEALSAHRTVDHPVLGLVDQVTPPFEIDGVALPIALAPPLLGEHADEILAELGYDAGSIAELRASGVI
jgi:crotonobetainyl-CoA:carnitine CoA-transferase CaiB-like acyl-CoA transferase